MLNTENRMRLRAIPILVVIVACVAALGAWTDRTHVTMEEAPAVAHVSKSWNAVVALSRRGRQLDGFRPIFMITDSSGHTRSVSARELGAGRYKVSVIFPQGGFYTYKVLVADRIAGRGTVYAVPAAQ
jgi:hypothetical protein